MEKIEHLHSWWECKLCNHCGEEWFLYGIAAWYRPPIIKMQWDKILVNSIPLKSRPAV